MVELKDNEKELLLELKTEHRNPRTLDLDLMSIKELLTIMNEEDKHTIEAVKKVIPEVERTVELVIRALSQGGRLIYAGAGTSGRLGILDAVECIPTFSTTDEVLGIMAGGEAAFVRAVEGAEDSKDEAKDTLEELKLCSSDVVVALTASGRTPYCIGALEYARSVGAASVGISCNGPALLSNYADIAIEIDAGPEVLTGSTRLKAGTSEKMVLNMISTASMVGIGKVYGNLMVDMKATNLKLIERAKRIVSIACDCSSDMAQEVLAQTQGNIKEAIVMINAEVSLEEAKIRLKQNKGFVRRSLTE
ncbi:MAG: N-acetylmuramic acid 6-phosphate etherase [Lachnospiraceae bacterium]